MNLVRTITLPVSGLVIVAGLAGLAPGFRPLAQLERTAQAAGEQIMTFDIACDCRTGSPAFFSGNRGDAWIVSGKIFPAGTLPTGEAQNDPTLPVRGIAPIGDWTCRGQSAFPFPSAIAAAYSSTPFAFNTQYFILNRGTLTLEGYPTPTGELLSLTGGIGSFAGATGDVEEAGFGTNGTGCPNFRATFKIQPGSLRGASSK